MGSKRGLDYAHDLTEAERRTLDLLLARVQPRRHRRLVAPALAGAAAALVLFAVAVVRLLAPDPPVAAAASPSSVLSGLAAAASRGADSSDNFLYRNTLEIGLRRKDRVCYVAALSSRIWVAAEATGESEQGSVSLALIDPPAGATVVHPCDSIHPIPAAPLVTAAVQDVRDAWVKAAASANLESYRRARGITDPHTGRFLGSIRQLPTDPHELDRVLRATCADGQCRWTLLVQIVTSPEAGVAHRTAALRAMAMDAGQARIEPEITGDVIGRQGITLAVPDVEAGTAHIIFDPSTGTVLQRTTTVDQHGTQRTLTTVYLESTRTAAMPG